MGGGFQRTPRGLSRCVVSVNLGFTNGKRFGLYQTRIHVSKTFKYRVRSYHKVRSHPEPAYIGTGGYEDPLHL